MAAGRQLARARVERPGLTGAPFARKLVRAIGKLVRPVQHEQPPQLGERFVVVLDTQLHRAAPRLAAGRYDDQSRRLAAADVAPGGLGRVERDEQALGDRQLSRSRVCRVHRRPHTLARHHVRLAGDLVALDVPGEGDAILTRVRRDLPGGVDDRHLPVARLGVEREERSKRLPRARALTHEPECLRPDTRVRRSTASRPPRRRARPTARAGRRRTSGSGPRRRARRSLRPVRRPSRCHAAWPAAYPPADARLGSRAGGAAARSARSRRATCAPTGTSRPVRLALPERCSTPTTTRRSHGSASCAPTARCAKGARQRALLEAEGVPFRGERVDLRVARLPDG